MTIANITHHSLCNEFNVVYYIISESKYSLLQGVFTQQVPRRTYQDPGLEHLRLAKGCLLH